MHISIEDLRDLEINTATTLPNNGHMEIKHIAIQWAYGKLNNVSDWLFHFYPATGNHQPQT